MIAKTSRQGQKAGRRVLEEYTSADAFVEALAIENFRGQADPWEIPWIFRGQRSANWPLTPSAWRDGSDPRNVRLRLLTQKFLGEAEARNIVNYVDAFEKAWRAQWLAQASAQAKAELEILREFVSIADSVGHPIPGDPNLAYSYWPDWHHELSDLGPDFYGSPVPATALAQHHGIPTRLLDWTRNPYVAAFFAACDVEGDGDDEPPLAVWALNSIALDGDSANVSSPGYRMFAVSRADNLFLRSQDGVFVYANRACSYLARTGSWPDLEQTVTKRFSRSPRLALRKLVLPARHAGDLLRSLSVRRITGAHMMPTYDNIAKALVTRWRWSNE